MRHFANSLGWTLAAAIALTGCGGGTDGTDAAKTLVQASPESAGTNCAAGGQRLRAGADANGDERLQDGEVQLTTFACNGPIAQLRFDITAIEVGDSRCPEGGNLVSIIADSSSGTQFVPFCNGAIGIPGPMGSSGAVGEAGPQGSLGSGGSTGFIGPSGSAGSDGATGATGSAGPAGSATSEPLPLGQFVGRQIVKGAVLSCSSVTLTSASAICVGMKLNGIDVFSASGVERNVICAAITGKTSFSSVDFAGGSDPHYVWDGSAWAPEMGSPIDHVTRLGCRL